MIGKKNIVFGFVFLIFTAVLGYPMVKTIQQGDVAKTEEVRKNVFSAIKEYQSEGFMNKETLEEMKPDQVTQEVVKAVVALNNAVTIRQEQVNEIRNPHAHGNLESLLNVVVGILLCFLGVNRMFKQLISWAFILGASLHAGMLYISTVMVMIFNITPDSGAYIIVDYASKLIYAGPPLLLLGLILTAVAAFIGFRGEPVLD